MTYKHAQKHHIKKSEKFIHWKVSKSKKLRKWPKKAKNCRFFGPGGTNFDPLFTIFCKSLLNMPKNIILKNKKNSITRKILSLKISENDQKWPSQNFDQIFDQFFANHF